MTSTSNLNSQSKKALSEKPIGYVLAILGGIAGGPIGVIASPLNLFLMTKVLKNTSDKRANRFRAWALSGIVVAPLCWFPLALYGNKLNKEELAKCNEGSIEVCRELGSSYHDQITNAEFNKILKKEKESARIAKETELTRRIEEKESARIAKETELKRRKEEKSQPQEESQANKTDYTISVKDLFDEFESNSVTAQDKYSGKVVAVTGMVDRVKNRTGNKINIEVIDLDDESFGWDSVICKHDRNSQVVRQFKMGDRVKVTGTFVGPDDGTFLQMKKCRYSYL